MSRPYNLSHKARKQRRYTRDDYIDYAENERQLRLEHPSWY